MSGPCGRFHRCHGHRVPRYRGVALRGVMVNDSTDYRIDAMPFGGVKGSGLGREGVRFALEEMTEPKVVCLNL